jgi:hypothetical protein
MSSSTDEIDYVFIGFLALIALFNELLLDFTLSLLKELT